MSHKLRRSSTIGALQWQPPHDKPTKGGMERTAAQWGCAPQVGNVIQRPKRAMEAKIKIT